MRIKRYGVRYLYWTYSASKIDSPGAGKNESVENLDHEDASTLDSSYGTQKTIPHNITAHLYTLIRMNWCIYPYLSGHNYFFLAWDTYTVGGWVGGGSKLSAWDLESPISTKRNMIDNHIEIEECDFFSKVDCL